MRDDDIEEGLVWPLASNILYSGQQARIERVHRDGEGFVYGVDARMLSTDEVFPFARCMEGGEDWDLADVRSPDDPRHFFELFHVRNLGFVSLGLAGVYLHAAGGLFLSPSPTFMPLWLEFCERTKNLAAPHGPIEVPDGHWSMMW